MAQTFQHNSHKLQHATRYHQDIVATSPQIVFMYILNRGEDWVEEQDNNIQVLLQVTHENEQYVPQSGLNPDTKNTDKKWCTCAQSSKEIPSLKVFK